MQGLSSDFEQFFLVKNNLLTSVHNDAGNANDAHNADAADDTDNAHYANDYNRVIGIAQLDAFSCANNTSRTHFPLIPDSVKEVLCTFIQFIQSNWSLSAV